MVVWWFGVLRVIKSQRLLKVDLVFEEVSLLLGLM